MADTIRGADDGLVMNEEGVGSWTYDKYAIVQMYAEMFVCATHNTWTTCFIDLYAGAGLSRTKMTKEVLKGSPILALETSVPFDTYIFCEQAADKFAALEDRCRNYERNISLIQGDCNLKIDEILQAVPQRALTLCFVDPYDLGINMTTIRRIARRTKTDFLCLLAAMDPNRNQATYEKQSSKKVELFLGNPSWRGVWEEAKHRSESFDDFLARQFGLAMEAEGYLFNEKYRLKPMLNSKGGPLYVLGLFSRNTLALKFWDAVARYSSTQRSFTFD